MKTRPLILVAALFATIRLILLWYTPLLRWDEAVYIAMGKYLWSMGTVGLWEPLRPIVTPLLYGFFWKIGADPILAGHIIGIVFSTTIVILTGLLGEALHSRTTGTIAAIMVAITPAFWYHADALLTDIPAAAIGIAALLLYLKKRPLACGIAAGAATLIRFPAGLALVSITLIALCDRKRHQDLWKICAGALLVCIPFLLFNTWMYHTAHGLFGGSVLPFTLSAQSQNNFAEAQPWYYYLHLLGFPTIWFALTAISIFLVTTRTQDWKHPLIIYLLVHVLYYSSIINRQDRFIFSFLPVIAIFSAWGLVHAWTWKSTRPVIIAGLILGLIATAHTDATYTSWRFDPPSPDYLAFLHFPQDHPGRTFLTSNPIPAAYTDARFYTYYHNVDEGLLSFASAINTSDYVIFSPDTYFCPQDNSTCFEKLATLGKHSQDVGSEVLHVTHEGREYYIYSHMIS